MIRDGQPISRMVVQLRNLGLITPEVAAELNDMQKTGASNVEIWNKLQDALGKFSGAMADTENTVNGRLGALQSAWDDAAREIGASVA